LWGIRKTVSQLDGGEGPAAADAEAENPGSGAPVQYLYFGIITVLMGTILVIFIFIKGSNEILSRPG
jgi:hypothetical protein